MRRSWKKKPITPGKYLSSLFYGVGIKSQPFYWRLKLITFLSSIFSSKNELDTKLTSQWTVCCFPLISKFCHVVFPFPNCWKIRTYQRTTHTQSDTMLIHCCIVVLLTYWKTDRLLWWKYNSFWNLWGSQHLLINFVSVPYGAILTRYTQNKQQKQRRDEPLAWLAEQSARIENLHIEMVEREKQKGREREGKSK